MEFDFNELVARAHFDYVGPAFPNWWANNKTKFVLPGLNNVNADQLTGGKYFMTLKLRDSSGKEYTLPNEPLISLSLAKTIVETPTVGKHRRGTVKEYICTEDYNISIRGVCFSDDMARYPAESVSLLNELFAKNEALEVVDSWFFTLFDINKVVLQEIEIDDMVGEEGLQRYTMRAVSDMDFYAEIDEQNYQQQQLLR